MKESQNFKLIDSTYGPNEAREVLSRLIKDKIKFLNQEIFSIQVRYGEDTTHMENRRAELCRMEEELIKPLQALSNDDYDIVIDCEVNFKIKTKDSGNHELAAAAV